jgi:hypothetical protein
MYIKRSRDAPWENKMNYKYLHVSKRLLEVPVIAEDGSLTNIKQIVAETRGRTYRNKDKRVSREKERRLNWKYLRMTKRETDDLMRGDRQQAALQ